MTEGRTPTTLLLALLSRGKLSITFAAPRRPRPIRFRVLFDMMTVALPGARRLTALRTEEGNVPEFVSALVTMIEA
jgi:hypothetical protein